MGLCNGFVASALGAIILPPHRYDGMKDVKYDYTVDLTGTSARSEFDK